MQDRIAQAVQALKAAKAQELNYYDASQSLLKQGFTPSEIEQASTQFTYSDVTPVNSASQNNTVDQAFAEGVIHQEAIEGAKQNFEHDLAVNLFTGGRATPVRGVKTLTDFAALHEIESKQPSSATVPASGIEPQLNGQNNISGEGNKQLATVLSQVPSLKTFILFAVGAATFQLLVLIIFHWALLASLIMVHYTVPGLLTTIIKFMLYVAQITVIVNFALCLALTLSKSFSRVQKIIKFTLVLTMLSFIANLLTGNVANAIFGIFLFKYIQGVSDDVYLMQTGGMK